MVRKLTRNELISALRARGIAFEKKAKVNVLRRIYDENIENDDADSEKSYNSSTAAAEVTHPDTTTKVQTRTQQPCADLGAAFQKYSESKKIETTKISDSDKKGDETFELDSEDQRRLDTLLTRVPTETELTMMKLKEEEELLDAQLRVQEKQLRLLRLQQQNCSDSDLKLTNSDLKLTNSDLKLPIVQQIVRPQYKDIKHLVSMFNGEEDYDASKWIADFERACDSINADERTKLVFLDNR